MLRGINRQNIFHDNEDKQQFYEILELCKGLDYFELYAFCLMSNHVHLLLKIGDSPIRDMGTVLRLDFIFN